ncbi:MAG: DUF333 domain-containing protein [Patescibacteria group bacterium]
MKQKRLLVAVIIILIVAFAGMLFVRFVLGGPEDTWICDKNSGEWIRHGQPKVERPTAACGEKIPVNCSSTDSTSADKCPVNLDQNQPTGLANPASVYCQQNGGKLDIRKNNDGSEYGICVFADKSECDEWKFFRQECQPKSGALQASSSSIK